MLTRVYEEVKIISFQQQQAVPVTRYNSELSSYLKIANLKEASIGIMYIEPGGITGHHEAPSKQLFLVIEGEGWVTSDDEVQVQVKKGQAALWEKGEWHTSGSDVGMTVIIIQGSSLIV
ncbi:cupin domain-containing protein [Priestia flexa]|uniref:Cupin domain-containing protein n=2 Tax=Priestia flexa TaxID=86664 RepID=A0A8I1MGI9_9BACI|nr:cupin domain-containing protein [Priestia flexa]RIV07023.1 cupin domain-containing protein [Priestia flexa]